MNFPGDRFTFRAVVQQRTGNGAYLLRAVDGGHRAFVPVKSCIVVPEAFDLGRQEVEITLSRSLAREKGFLRESGRGQGRLDV